MDPNPKPEQKPRKLKALKALKVPLRPNGKPMLPYDPKINRWTGREHEHKREKARVAKR